MKSYTGFRLPPNSMTLDDLERQNRGFCGFFFRDIGLRKSISFAKRRHRRQRHTRLWPKCTMVPMGRVQMICDFQNYNYWTGNAIGFHASSELCSNFLYDTWEIDDADNWLDWFRVVGVEGAGDRGEWSWYSRTSRHAATSQQCCPWGWRVCACGWASRSTTQSHRVCIVETLVEIFLL